MRARISAILLLLFLPGVASAEADWFASLYTNEGIELRADERIFTLYALLNAMGYDEAPVVRQNPVPARDLHPVRLRVREALKLDSGLTAKASSYFDAHPSPAESYARYALSVGGPPTFERSAAAPPDLKGAEALLADAYGRQKLAAMFATVLDEYRAALKGYHAVVDGPVGSLKKLLKLKDDDPTRLVLVVNLLDARGKAYAAAVGDELYVVVGPSKDPDLFAVAREVARARLEPMVAGKVASTKGLSEALLAGRESSTDDDSPTGYAVETLSRVIAARAVGLSDPEIENQARGGYGAVRELVKAVDGFAKTDKPLEAFVADGLATLSKEKEAAGTGKKPKGK